MCSKPDMPVISLTTPPSNDELPTAVQLLTLTRSDTGQTPQFVTLPAAFQPIYVQVGPVLQFQGQWAFPFVDDNPAPAYTWSARATFSDGTGANFSGTLNGEKLVAGTYATRADMDQQIGSDQVDALARKSDGTIDDTLIAGALLNADRVINAELKIYSCAAPTTDNLDYLRSIAARFACNFEYNANPSGIAMAGDKGVDWRGKMKDMWDSAMRDLQELLFNNRGGFTRVNGYSDAPVAVAPTLTPAGEPVGTAVFPVPRWNGYWWQYGQ